MRKAGREARIETGGRERKAATKKKSPKTKIIPPHVHEVIVYQREKRVAFI